MAFALPPRLKNEKNEFRRVGFELEYGGLELDQCALLIQQIYGGEIQRESRYKFYVNGTKLGHFVLEVDSYFLKEMKYKNYFDWIGLSPDSQVGKQIENLIATTAGQFVPFEVITPPIDIMELDQIEKLRESLQAHHAYGTGASVLAAFGMQFNPEVPDKKVETLLAYMRAFFLLYDWLYQESEVDITRRLGPFINEFPKDYITFILDSNYTPDLGTFMHDYLRFSPTRNRPLDLLPLFADIDPAIVALYPVEHHLVHPRPTFHYRLPNSQVDRTDWSIATEWNRWVEVEKLSAQPELIKQMSFDYLALHRGFGLRSRWITRTHEWMNREHV